MEYKVETAGDNEVQAAFAKLSERVNAAIRQGWQPIGGVNTVYEGTKIDERPFIYAIQALTKGQ